MLAALATRATTSETTRTAAQETAGRLLARDARKSDGPFSCPECGAEVVLHRGTQRIAHFAHKPPVTCEYGTGETEAHRQCKTAIFDALTAAGVPCELETPLDGARPDVFFLWNNRFTKKEIPCAIEVQRSNLSVETIERRTTRYHALGVFVLWLCLFDEKLSETMYSPRPFELWLHAAYFKQVYYWREGLRIQPVSFAPIIRRDDYRTWYAPGDGEARLSGGERRLKRGRTPVLSPECDLLADFSPRLLAGWEGGGIALPPRRLFMSQKMLQKKD